MNFVGGKKATDKFVPLSTDDDVENMSVMQLAHLSCKQLNHLLHQIATVTAFCSTHIDNLTAHLKELNKIDHLQEPRKIGPQIPGWSNSINKFKQNWTKYGAAIIANEDIPSTRTVVNWVKHWMQKWEIYNLVPTNT